jgi:Iron-containing redox enzyme
MRRYSETLTRLGVSDAARFYDTHVEADARHEVVALYDMAEALAHDEPQLATDIVFGARALDALERRFTAQLLDAWHAGTSSLLPER